MDRDFDYNLKIAEYIFEIFKSNLPVVWSWGIDPANRPGSEIPCARFQAQGLRTGGI